MEAQYIFQLLQILQQLRIVETVKFGCRDGGNGLVPYRGFRECQKCKCFWIDEPDIIGKKALF